MPFLNLKKYVHLNVSHGKLTQYCSKFDENAESKVIQFYRAFNRLHARWNGLDEPLALTVGTPFNQAKHNPIYMAVILDDATYIEAHVALKEKHTQRALLDLALANGSMKSVEHLANSLPMNFAALPTDEKLSLLTLAASSKNEDLLLSVAKQMEFEQLPSQAVHYCGLESQEILTYVNQALQQNGFSNGHVEPPAM